VRDGLETFEGRKCKVRCRNLKGKAFTEQPGHLLLVFERVEAGDNPTRAVAEQDHLKTSFPRLDQLHKPGTPMTLNIVAAVPTAYTAGSRFALFPYEAPEDAS